MSSFLDRIRARIAAPLLAPIRAELANTTATLRATCVENDHLFLTASIHAEEVHALRDRLNAASSRPRVLVREARRRAILAIVADLQTGPRPVTALDIAGYAKARGIPIPSLRGLTEASVARIVSDLDREGWISNDRKKPAGYTLTEQGWPEVADGDRSRS